MTKEDKKARNTEMLHAVGLKATPARLSVLRCLQKQIKPMSIDMLSRHLGDKRPNIVTLYRMMKDLLEKGLVRRVEFGQGAVLFELAGHSHHHHIVCKQCGYVEAISGCAIEHILRRAKNDSEKFEKITDHSFEIFGICKKCAQ